MLITNELKINDFKFLECIAYCNYSTVKSFKTEKGCYEICLKLRIEEHNLNSRNHRTVRVNYYGHRKDRYLGHIYRDFHKDIHSEEDLLTFIAYCDEEVLRILKKTQNKFPGKTFKFVCIYSFPLNAYVKEQTSEGVQYTDDFNFACKFHDEVAANRYIIKMNISNAKPVTVTQTIK